MTAAKEDTPTKRLVFNRDGDVLIIEVYARRIVMRPKGSRRGGPAEREVSPGVLYQRLMTPR
jgi:hypothetical protein